LHLKVSESQREAVGRIVQQHVSENADSFNVYLNGCLHSLRAPWLEHGLLQSLFTSEEDEQRGADS